MRTSRKLHPTHLAVALAGVFAVSFWAYADLGGPNGVLIPYQGYIRMAGVPVTSEIQLTFNVWDQQTGGTMCHTETQQVTPAAGSFAVTIGPLPSGCLIDNDVWLELEDPSNNVMGARQRVMPSVSSATSGRGDFDVTGTLDVGGLVSANGGLDVYNGIDIRDGALVRASAAQKDLDVNGHTETDSLDVVNNAVIGSDGSGNLTVNGTFTTNTLDVTQMNVQSDLSITGDITATGTVQWSCPAGTNRVGGKCITNSQGSGDVGQALAQCDSLGMELCDLQTIMMCDQVGSPSGGNQCGTVTDLTRDWDDFDHIILTGTPYLDSDDAFETMFTRMSCYYSSFRNHPVLPNASNFAVNCSSGSHYYCCAPITAE
jgi:hypothetical protein